MQISGRVFLVTGAASGLGAATARMLVAAGGSVLAADLNLAAAQTLADALGPACHAVATDVTDETAVEQALDTAEQRFGPVAGVVQCAGILAAGRVVGKQGPHDLAMFQRVIQTNLVGTFNVLRLAATRMSTAAPDAEGERGVIVNTASVSAFEGQIGQAAYAAAKGGVASMTLPVARELARFGIRCVAIAPGVFETPMMSALTGDARSALAAQAPFPARLGRPAEFADLVRQIVENPMHNGSVIRLDGALRMSGK